MITVLLATALAAAASDPPGRGVSESLAAERSAAIRDLRYELHVSVPAARQDPVRGRVSIRFSLQDPHRIVLDFAPASEKAGAVGRVAVNGRDVAADLVDGHIVIPATATQAGANQIDVEFVSDDASLNRNEEFLYTLFVPARAQFAFPCFDQPDLKARYTLTLEVPDGWQAISNGAEGTREGRRVVFAETAPLSTYVFAFVAGRFQVETAVRNGRQLRIFHRETDAAKTARNREALFDLHGRSLDWLEEYTAIPYPFGKFDVVLIPSFQFSGMEHAGAILYNQSALMLDESATQNQLLSRASVIAHESAHMWFGDLVTMKWFNDVWMKEVFANFMAAKIVNPSFPEVNHELRFLLAHYPSAYQVDRTAGTNPVRQSLGNLSDAGQMYGPIIYEKAPIVMRQLELIVGESVFRDAMREYLREYQFANATWLDLVRILDRRTPRDVTAWSRAWVEERGRPEFTTAIRTDRRGRLSGVRLTARDPLRRGVVWPQQLSVALGYADRIDHVDLYVSRSGADVAGVSGREVPLYVLPNGRGLGYGLFVLDPRSRDYLLARVEEIPDALTRGSAWVTLWDNLLERQFPASVFLDAAMRALPSERDEQNAQRILTYATRAFWRWLSPEERSAYGPRLEDVLRHGIDRAPTQSQKAAWFNAYRDIAMSRGALTWLERIWRREERVPGLTLAEQDEITLAMELAVREVPSWSAILAGQLERTENPDRKARLAFVIPALSADARTREEAFDRFRLLENRRREPWVLDSLAYLNHPLRAAQAERFVRPALERLREIQQTGDIFFPFRWMDATLWGHRSMAVAATVQEFLAAERDYPQRLRWTILSTADELFRITR